MDVDFQNFSSLFSNTDGKETCQKWAQKKQQIFSDLLLVVSLRGGGLFNFQGGYQFDKLGFNDFLLENIPSNFYYIHKSTVICFYHKSIFDRIWVVTR